jgi:tetratricopeptide (TPR) repeat protein
MEKPFESSEPNPAAAHHSHTAIPVQVEADFAPVKGGRPASGSLEDQSLRAQSAFELAAKTNQAGDEENAVDQYLCAANLAESAREWYLAAVACERVGDFLQRESPARNLERAFRMYRRAIASYEQCGLFDEAADLEYRLMKLKMKKAGELRLSLRVRLELAFSWATAGFGFRPVRAIFCAVILVMAFAVLYWVTGGVESTNDDEPETANFSECVYFSGTTFATINYGDFIPKEHMRFPALFEGAFGVCTLGYFAVILSNRMRH